MMAAPYLDLAAQVLALLACGVIVWRVEPALNRMSRCSSLMINAALYLIFVAALCAAWEIIVGGAVPPWPAAIGAAGVALLLLCERRLRHLARQPKDRGVTT